jgi:hypothetical protein
MHQSPSVNIQHKISIHLVASRSTEHHQAAVGYAGLRGASPGLAKHTTYFNPEMIPLRPSRSPTEPAGCSEHIRGFIQKEIAISSPLAFGTLAGINGLVFVYVGTWQGAHGGLKTRC